MLPLVASMTVCPGLRSPDRSAASITPSARRSLTDPSGLNASILTNRLIPEGARLLMRTTGVLPTVPNMLSNLAIRPSVCCDCRVASCVFTPRLPDKGQLKAFSHLNKVTS